MKNYIQYIALWFFTLTALTTGAQAAPYAPKEVGEQAAWTRQQILHCTQKETDARDQQLIDQEVLFLRFEHENRDQLLKSTAMLNDEQAKALKNFRHSLLRCRVLSKQFPLPSMVDVYQNYYDQIDQIYDGLLAKKMTIGEANRKKMKLLEETQTKWSTIEDSIRKNNAAQ